MIAMRSKSSSFVDSGKDSATLGTASGSLALGSRRVSKSSSKLSAKSSVRARRCLRRCCKVVPCGCCPRKLGGGNPAQVSTREKLAYLLDRVFAKRWALALMMAILGSVQVLIGGLAYAAVWNHSDRYDGRSEDEVNRFEEGIWWAWQFMADPGTFSSDFRPEQRVVGSLISIGGILFFAALLGMTVDAIREKMDSLRKGKSKIIEQDHHLVLGWTQKTFHIIEELCNANESEGGGVIAVLAPEDKERMEQELKLQLPERLRRGSRIVIRSGSPLVMGDLVRASAHMAKAIIILATSIEADEADANTLRALLSLNTLYNQALNGFIVAEVRDIDNDALVKLVGNQGIETVVSHDMIGRLILMSVRQPGLAKVYEALLGFEGDEFYMKEWPELAGLSFGELQLRFPDAIPIGIFGSDGAVYLKPSPSYIIREGDEIIVIAEDDDTYRPESPVPIEGSAPPAEEKIEQQVEKILICGWRRDVRDILKLLDRIARKGTEVHMLTHCVPIKDRNARLLEDGLDVTELRHITLLHHYGNTTVRRHLESLPIEAFTSCMIFADQAFETDSMYADSHSLATLLLIRDIQANRVEQHSKEMISLPEESQAPPLGSDFASVRSLSFEEMESAISRLSASFSSRRIIGSCPIVCEILDPHTQTTIVGNKHLCKISDFCQTNRLTAQVMAMVAEERAVRLLLDELLGSSGCNIALVPSSRYVRLGERISFYELSQRAQHFNELVVGYQRRTSIEKTVLNPRRKGQLIVWDKFDFAILQGDMRGEKPHHMEVRNAAMGSDTQWYDSTLERMQVAARAFAVCFVEAANPQHTCEAALLQMSLAERKRSSSAVTTLQESLDQVQTLNSARLAQLQEGGWHTSVGSARGETSAMSVTSGSSLADNRMAPVSTEEEKTSILRRLYGHSHHKDSAPSRSDCSCSAAAKAETTESFPPPGFEQLTPSLPKATASAPATLPRSGSGSLKDAEHYSS